jgi:hypothetical protein
VAALATLAFSAALAAALVDLARTELRLTSQRRRAARLLAALDACLADVVADVPAGWDFTALLKGPDATSGTPDDGVLPAPENCAARARPAPGSVTPARAIVRIEAQLGAGRRALDATVRRTPEAGAGALVWLSEPPEGDAVTGLVALDGSHPSAPVASLAAPAAVETLDAWIAGEGAALAIAPATAPPVWAPVPPLADLGGRILAAPHGGAEALVTAGEPVATVVHVAGDLILDDARRGAGLLFVDGALDVRGLVEFAGVVVATGGIRVAAGASLAVDGALWLGAGSPTLRVEGSLVVRHAAEAVAAADALLPLPRRGAVASAGDVG